METEGDLRRLTRLKRALSATVSAGLLSAVLVVVWVIHYREGLAWDGALAEFNWHPVLNLTGFIFLQGMAIIVYRHPWTWKWNKLWVKIIHAGLHSSAFVFAVIAFVAVFDFHNNAGIPNMYSLHSWLGMVALVLYSLQIVLGIGLYLLPIAPVSLKAAFMPLHVYSGLFIFSSTIATALMGITEKLIFGLKDPKYKDSPPEATFVNLLGLVIVVFGALVFWIVTQSHWKRPSDQVFHSLQTEASTIVRPALSQHPGGLDPGACDDFRRRGIKQEAVDLQD